MVLNHIYFILANNPKQLKNDEIYPEPRTACQHFNMIEMLKVEENKKKGGIGVSSKNKASSNFNN